MENQTDENVLRFLGKALTIIGIIILPLSLILGAFLLDMDSGINLTQVFIFGPIAGLILIIWGSLFKVIANISISLKNSSKN